ncbi:MAG: SUMF1/EgtB/PvdO family nonheme iron enzyme [Chloroflexi bacterium]|nr:SUMF1/EgtB/PvdO family nonheme iron enzyme [Chloroflexota bacterium]
MRQWALLQASAAQAGTPALHMVGSYPEGASPYGVFDLAGNASEWVWDWYNWSDYSKMPARNPLSQAPPWNHSVRGSAWFDPYGSAEGARQSSRCGARSSSHASNDPRIGFRCARSTP